MPWTDLLPGRGWSSNCLDVCVGPADKREPLRCLRFRSDPERTCKWMCVWRWNSLNVIKSICINMSIWWWRIYSLLNTLVYSNSYRSHGVELSMWHAKMHWSRLCWKAGFVADDQSIACLGKALYIAWLREPHTPVWVKNGIRTAGSAHVSF